MKNIINAQNLTDTIWIKKCSFSLWFSQIWKETLNRSSTFKWYKYIIRTSLDICFLILFYRPITTLFWHPAVRIDAWRPGRRSGVCVEVTETKSGHPEIWQVKLSQEKVNKLVSHKHDPSFMNSKTRLENLFNQGFIPHPLFWGAERINNFVIITVLRDGR